MPSSGATPHLCVKDNVTGLVWEARAAAAIRAALKSKGQPIGAYDVLIAGMGAARGLVVVTSNVGEFKRVSGLQVEDWR